MDSGISSMAITNNKKHLFVSDYEGLVKKINLESKPIIESFYKAKQAIFSIASSKDDRYLYTCCNQNAIVKQFSINTKVKIYNFQKKVRSNNITCLLVTHNNKFLFVGEKGY